MNKADLTLFFVLGMFSFLLFLYFQEEKGTLANVYYDKELILQINLEKDETYTVMGANGEVTLEVKRGIIKVLEENSPNHICSKQAGISSPGESLICLPNKIVIEIEQNEFDAIVK